MLPMLMPPTFLAALVTTPLTSPGLLGTITFAKPLPSHNLDATNATVELHPQATPDCRNALALNRTGGGRVLFDMAVSPTEVAHLSVKCWGGVSIVNGTPFESQSNTWLLDSTCRISPTTGKCGSQRWQQHGWAHSFPCELDQADPGRSSALDGSLPGRWQCATCPLPREWTANKTTLRLGLGTGLFQWHGAPGHMPSRQEGRGHQGSRARSTRRPWPRPRR